MTNNKEQELEALLPRGYYEGRDLAFRIERMVSSWQRAIRSNVELSTELEEALQANDIKRSDQCASEIERRHPEHTMGWHYSGPQRRLIG